MALSYKHSVGHICLRVLLLSLHVPLMLPIKFQETLLSKDHLRYANLDTFPGRFHLLISDTLPFSKLGRTPAWYLDRLRSQAMTSLLRKIK